jgi:hypothetical protein
MIGDWKLPDKPKAPAPEPSSDPDEVRIVYLDTGKTDKVSKPVARELVRLKRARYV